MGTYLEGRGRGCALYEKRRMKKNDSQFQAIKAELAAERERFREFFEAAPAFMAVLKGKKHVFEMANRAYYKVAGRRDVIGKPLLAAMPELKGQGYAQMLDKVMKTGRAFSGDNLKMMVRRDPKGPLAERFVDLVFQAIRGEGRGKQNGVIGIFVHGYDVTDKVIKTREVDKLISSIEIERERFRSLLETIPQMTWTNLPDGEIIFYNQRWYDFTGRSHEETKEGGWASVVHPDDLAKTMQAYFKSLKEGTRFEVENRYRRGSDGAYRWFLNRALPLRDVNGKIYLWVGTATDIHAKKVSERHKDEFISIASHELKTPITSLKLFSDILADKLHNVSDHDVTESVSMIGSQVNRLMAMLNDLLDISKMQADKLELSLRPLDLNALVRDLAEEIRRTRKTHAIEVRADPLPRILADKARISQVLTNLMVNAIKYSPEARKIIVRTKKNRQTVQVSVQDFGVGILKEDLQRIFEPFFRTKNIRHTDIPGVGLGLHICKKIIENHGGEVRVSSVAGKGSVFTITLPITNKES